MEENGPIQEERVYRILVVDDEKETLKALIKTIERANQFRSEVVAVESGEEALEELEKRDFDLVLSDNILTGMSGIELLTQVRESNPQILRMLITGFSDLDTARQALYEAGVNNFVEKPWNIEELRLIINAALHRKHEREVERSSEFDSVADALMQVDELRAQLPKMAPETILTERPKLRFEFDSWRDFNRFTFGIKKLGNICIFDVYTFENRYVIVVSVNLPTHTTMKKSA